MFKNHYPTSERLMITKVEYNVIIANQSNPYNAIAANFYKLAQGLSGQRKTFLHLISCSKEYEDFVRVITSSYNIQLNFYKNLNDFLLELKNKRPQSSIFIFSAWVTPL